MKNGQRPQYPHIIFLMLFFLSVTGTTAAWISPALANSDFAGFPMPSSTAHRQRALAAGEKILRPAEAQTPRIQPEETSTAWLSSSDTLSPVTDVSPETRASPEPFPDEAALMAALEKLFKALETVTLLSLEVHTNQLDNTYRINISATINLPGSLPFETPGQGQAGHGPGKNPSGFMQSYLAALKKPEVLMLIPEAIKTDSTPEAIAHYFWKHYSYETDQQQFGKEEYWQSPEEFLQNKKGDCEDFALMQQALLKLNGYASFLVNVYSLKTAHTVCVFKDQGTYGVIDGTDVKRFDAANIQDLFTAIHPFWRQGTLVTYSPDDKKGHVLKKFKRD